MSDKEYGIADLAKKLGVEPAAVRARLRSRKVKKNGKSYSWTKAQLEAVVKQLSPKAEKKATPKKASKPAKKTAPAENAATA